mmetsp:Transcript_2617/g.3651  ORF Transcript_2617/g.3651 Transcript_2617/m.3651 type:complete len:189 (+) Transcript_2617:155-721(+)
MDKSCAEEKSNPIGIGIGIGTGIDEGKSTMKSMNVSDAGNTHPTDLEDSKISSDTAIAVGANENITSEDKIRNKSVIEQENIVRDNEDINGDHEDIDGDHEDHTSFDQQKDRKTFNVSQSASLYCVMILICPLLVCCGCAVCTAQKVCVSLSRQIEISREKEHMQHKNVIEVCLLDSSERFACHFLKG